MEGHGLRCTKWAHNVFFPTHFQLAVSVRKWHLLTSLRSLTLWLDEVTDASDPELQPLMYDDPDLLTASVWSGVFPMLSQLSALRLTSNEIPQSLWEDLASCSGLSLLCLRHTQWGLDFDITLSPFLLCNLKVSKDVFGMFGWKLIIKISFGTLSAVVGALSW